MPAPDPRGLTTVRRQIVTLRRSVVIAALTYLGLAWCLAMVGGC